MDRQKNRHNNDARDAGFQSVLGSRRRRAALTLAMTLAMTLAAALWFAPETTAAEPADAQGRENRLAQASTGERDQLVSQMANVKRLLHTSSGAQRVLSGTDDLAKRIRLDALERYGAAEAAHAAGNDAEARRLLDEAARVMFQAVRMLAPTEAVKNRKIGNFESRVASTRVLLDALKRIAVEEGKQVSVANTVAGVETAIASAQQLVQSGQVDDARKLLDGGYELAKAAVESLRDGKTLVRSLTFESKEDEYRYELDRNDTHHMLVRVVLREKQPSAQSAEMVDASVQKAGQLRQQAEQRAADGAFEQAIELLEQSTQELVRAIRGAGLYIPG